MTTKKLMGLFASVALMSSGMALANEGKKHDSQHQQTQNQGSTNQGSSIGGSGTVGTDQGSSQSGQMGQGSMHTQLSGNQLTGRVVKNDKKTVWIEHAGAIVPLKIDKNTQFADPSLKRAQDIKEGDEIRASFEIRKTDNVATSIEKSTNSGMGGSGTEVMSPDSSINQSPGTLPPNDGTGGSGRDSDVLSPDIHNGAGSDIHNGTGGSGSNLGTGSDVNPDSNQGKTGDY
ncbi:hypothetical protein [Hyalangium versicolor]|uniref:hypothetical protein n=1 Tax=Hyalangium versicolor TaxID=2861190 RepID=UPI001CCE81CB|nr:hypothetical protein [Hyalangium versicolor]